MPLVPETKSNDKVMNGRLVKNSFLSCVISVCLVLGFLGISWGHGVLIESSPSHGAILKKSPSLISLRFNAALEPSITQVSLVDLKHQTHTLHITDESTLERIVATVPPLPPGVYHVHYQVLATDGHVTEGFIRFTILTQ